MNELTIIIPLAGKDIFFDPQEYYYPKILIEINGRTMIERVIENLETIQMKKRFVFIVRTHDCEKFHIDATLSLLAESESVIVKLDGETKGALCTSLLAIANFNHEDPVVICNSDQILDIDLNEPIDYFLKNGNSAGVITFRSVHPRWSYVRLDENNQVVEAAEKNPLSTSAIAGFYFFSKGKFFIHGAMKLIKNDGHCEGAYYIAPVLNELILENMSVGNFTMPKEKYYTFYTPKKIEEFEKNFKIAS